MPDTSRTLVAPEATVPLRTWRTLVALVFGHRERAIILDALGVPGAVAWREAATLDGLVDRARLVRGGCELLAQLLRAELDDGERPSGAEVAEAWADACRQGPRDAARLLWRVASAEGACMRRLEERMLDDLEARAWEALRQPRRPLASVPARGAMVHP